MQPLLSAFLLPTSLSLPHVVSAGPWFTVGSHSKGKAEVLVAGQDSAPPRASALTLERCAGPGSDTHCGQNTAFKLVREVAKA